MLLCPFDVRTQLKYRRKNIHATAISHIVAALTMARAVAQDHAGNAAMQKQNALLGRGA